jgi:hypothetical protein
MSVPEMESTSGSAQARALDRIGSVRARSRGGLPAGVAAGFHHAADWRVQVYLLWQEPRAEERREPESHLCVSRGILVVGANGREAM